MQTIFYVTGTTNRNQDLKRAFSTKIEADNFSVNLLNCKIIMLQGKTKLEAANKILISLQRGG